MKITRKLTYTIAVSVALVTAIVYLPALRNGFVGVWDDNIYIVENPHIRSLDAAFFRWAFLDFYASNWHPLTWMSLALDYALWGMNSLGFHLTNIILHAANAALVTLLALKLIEMAQKRPARNVSASFLNDRTILIAAGATGLLFGIHPVHVESVAWAAERKDLLCALFFLLSILSYMSYVSYKGSQEPGVRSQESEVKNQREVRFYLLSLGLFVLALMSKPMAVSLPVVLLILDWYPFGRIQSWKSFRSVSIEKLPFIALSLASSIITVLAQRSGESVVSLEFMPFSSRILVAGRSLIAYLGKMLLPLELVTFYPYPKEASLYSFEYLASIFLLAGITGICLALAGRQKLWLSVWGYYGVTLIPVLGIVQVGNQAMADRYAYLPSIGPFLAAGIVMAWIAKKVTARFRSGKVIYTGIALCLFFPLSALTVKQTTVWENGFVLWNHTISKGFESAAAYNNRGLSLDERGMREEALADFNRAIALDSRNYFAYNNLGVLYGKRGLFSESIEYFLKAVALNPGHADSYCNLGLSYFNLHEYKKALENYDRAIGLKGDFGAAYLNRGNLYYVVGNKDLALTDYRTACSLGNAGACEALSLLRRKPEFR